MNPQPTVVILASPPPESLVEEHDPDAATASAAHRAGALLQSIMATGLPVVLVTDGHSASEDWSALASKDVVGMPFSDSPGLRKDWMARAMATGVITRSDAQGWIFVPADMPTLKSSTLMTMARALAEGPLVFPSHQHLRGRVFGANAEMHAELVRLRTDHDLRRLISRFPAVEVTVTDPSVHGVPHTLAPHALASPQRSGVVSSPW